MWHQLRFSVLLLVGLVLALGVSPGSASDALAAEQPVAVSPGSATGSVIGDACPTFSWGAVLEAQSYELVVYDLDGGVEAAQPVLRQSFAGSVYGWTPSLDRCLERGGQYAWSVRAVGADDASEWSSPSLFEVVAGPSEAEFEEALMVVRQYLASSSETQPAAAETAPSASKENRTATAEEPESLAPAATQLSVDGNVHATSFTGDGSNLTGTVAEARIDPTLARDAELTAAIEALDCPAGQFLTQVDGGVPVCLSPHLEKITPASGGAAATIPGEGTFGPADPYPSILTVASFVGTLTDVNVTLTGLSHTFSGDLGILLVGPTGQSVLLMRNVGFGASNVDLTFDDEAGQAIGDSALSSGSYRPWDNGSVDLPTPAPGGPYGSTLASLDGSDPVGNWKLYINDYAGGDSGSLTSWSLELADGTNSPVVPVAQGGTGANNAAEARINLGAASVDEPALEESVEILLNILAHGSVGQAHQPNIYSAVVECNGSCADGTLGEVCDVLSPGWVPVGGGQWPGGGEDGLTVSGGTVIACGADNTCVVGPGLSRANAVSTLGCGDRVGLDCIVFCGRP